MLDSTTEPPDIALLIEALDNTDVGLSVFDGNRTLVFCNRRFLELFAYPARLATPGIPYESFARFDAERGELGAGDPETLIRDDIANAFDAGTHERVRIRTDGRQIQSATRPLPSGGWVTTHRERITEDIGLPDSALTLEALRHALDHAPDGFRVWDRDDRLLYANARVRSF